MEAASPKQAAENAEQAVAAANGNKERDAATAFSLELNPDVDTFTVLGAGTDHALGAAPVDGQFHYYACSISGSSVSMYSDGADVTTDPTITPVATSTNTGRWVVCPNW